MVKCENGQIEYDGDGLRLIADVMTIVIAIRDMLLEKADDSEAKAFLNEFYIQEIEKALSFPVGQSDQERAASRKNP